ncbi:MAG: response regulator [Pseudomonadota bacterium]|nr:response regulator [Pseudomonadota bacterium]
MNVNDVNIQCPSLVALVVDDLPSIRWIISRRLKEMGFCNVIEARDGDNAIEILSVAAEKGLFVGLIVSDLHMPNIDGIEFLRLIKSFPEFQNIPFVLMGNSSPKWVSNGPRELNEISFVLKPINTESFRDKVNEALQKSPTGSPSV